MQYRWKPLGFHRYPHNRFGFFKNSQPVKGYPPKLKLKTQNSNASIDSGSSGSSNGFFSDFDFLNIIINFATCNKQCCLTNNYIYFF